MVAWVAAEAWVVCAARVAVAAWAVYVDWPTCADVRWRQRRPVRMSGMGRVGGVGGLAVATPSHSGFSLHRLGASVTL